MRFIKMVCVTQIFVFNYSLCSWHITIQSIFNALPKNGKIHKKVQSKKTNAQLPVKGKNKNLNEYKLQFKQFFLNKNKAECVNNSTLISCSFDIAINKKKPNGIKIILI